MLDSVDYGYMPGFPHSYPTTLVRRQCEQVVAGYHDGTMTIPNADGGTSMLTAQSFVPGGAFVMRLAP